MKYAPLWILATALALAGCKDKPAETPPATETATATSMSDVELLAAAEAASKASADPNAAVATPASTPAADPAATTPPPATPSAGAIPGLVLGTDYEVIRNGQPFEPLNGKIEVVEVFNFVCPACASFQPLVVQWKKTLPADVRFTYVPAAFGGNWDQFVRSYYAAEAMGIAVQAHEKTYDAIHLQETLKGERGNDSDEDLAKFYAQFGVDPKQFASNMKSFAVAGKFNKAKQYIIDQGVNSTPTVIVNGKYRARGRSMPDIFRVTDALIAHERAMAAGKP